MKKVVGEIAACILSGFFLGVIGLALGYAESRTGALQGIEPGSFWLIAFCLGIYSMRWILKPQRTNAPWARTRPNEREAGLFRGLIRALLALLPFTLVATQATGLVDLRVDGYAQSNPFLETATQIYGVWLAGILVSAIVVGIIRAYRGIRRTSRRVTA